MDRGAWGATVCGVTKSRTRLSTWSWSSVGEGGDLVLSQGKCRVPAPHFLRPPPSASTLVSSWRQRDDGGEKPQTLLQPQNDNRRLRASLKKASVITVISEKSPWNKNASPSSETFSSSKVNKSFPFIRDNVSDFQSPAEGIYLCKRSLACVTALWSRVLLACHRAVTALIATGALSALRAPPDPTAGAPSTPARARVSFPVSCPCWWGDV